MNRPLALTETEGATAPSIRQQLEAEIERLIGLLDELDGDENLEPWLADNGLMLSADGRNYVNVQDDREGDPCDEGEPGTDDEPSMGWHIPGSNDITRPPLGWSYARFGGTAGDYED